jgi:hypothetical protein
MKGEELINKFGDQLKDYKYIDDLSKLAVDHLVKYVKECNTKSPKLVKGGRIIEIQMDAENKKKVHKIKLRSTVKTEWFVKVASDICFFYKEHTVAEQRKLKIEEWKKSKTEDELKEYQKMREERQKQYETTIKMEQKTFVKSLTAYEKRKRTKMIAEGKEKEFEEWYNDKHPDKKITVKAKKFAHTKKE